MAIPGPTSLPCGAVGLLIFSHYRLQPVKLRTRKQRNMCVGNAVPPLWPLCHSAIALWPFHQSTLIFKHMRNHTHVNACVQVSYLPCVYTALASRTNFKLERERRAWNLPCIPTSTHDTGNKSCPENIKRILLMCWARSYPLSPAAGHLYCRQAVFTEQRSSPLKIRRVHCVFKVILVPEGHMIQFYIQLLRFSFK